MTTPANKNVGSRCVRWNKTEAMAGYYRRIVNAEDSLLTAGVTGMLWRFSRNAGEFTLGHGGYFSVARKSRR